VPGAIEEAAAGVQIQGGGRLNTPPSQETNAKFDNFLFKQIRRDVASNEDAVRIRDQFKQSLFAGGLTPDLLRSLPPSARSALTTQLQRPLGQGFENPEVLATGLESGRIRPLDANRVINAGAQPNAELDKAAEGARNLTQSFEALQAAISRRIEQLSGDHAGLGPKIDSAARGIDNFQPDTKLIGGLFDNLNPVAVFGTLFSRLSSALTPSPTPAPPDVSGFTDGRRYSRQLNPTPVADDVSEAGKSLAAAITEAANAVRNATPTQPVQQKAGGGAVWGAGTATSDSIPAMLSHGEYVINANAASKIGLANLDRLNGYRGGGPIQLADGGSSSGYDASPEGGEAAHRPAMLSGSYDVRQPTMAAPSSMASSMVPARRSWRFRRSSRRWRVRVRRRAQESKRTHKSDFVGIFGGHNFDTPGSYAKGGPIGHFATGGIMPDFSAGSAPSLSAISPRRADRWVTWTSISRPTMATSK
jgi:hypothetical protein